jgi:hypothetical protein
MQWGAQSCAGSHDWGLYLVVRERLPLEIFLCSPLVLREQGGGSAGGMGEQASAMIQRFLEVE